MASDTRRTASSWPTTRSCSFASICSSFSRSPCIIFDTGMPVARDTTSAISSAPTSVRSSRALPGFGDRLFLFLQLRLELRNAAVLQLRHALPVALALGRFHLELELFQLFLDVLRALHLGLFRLPHFFQVGVLAPELA